MSKVSMDSKIERELVAKAQLDPDEFAPLYQHYYPHIRRFFAVKLPKAEVIDDLTSITFEKALKGIGNFSWRGYPFSSWLYRIASNTLVDYFRKQGNSRFVPLNENLQIADKAKAPDQELELEFDSIALTNLLKELPDRERSIIYMKFFDGYTNKTIAEKLTMTETNVSTVVSRSIAKLRGLLLSK